MYKNQSSHNIDLKLENLIQRFTFVLMNLVGLGAGHSVGDFVDYELESRR